MTSVLTIEAVHPGAPRDWNNTNGFFKGYTITVRSVSNGETRDVEWNRKVDAQGRWNEPKVGDQIEADVLKMDYPPGWRLKNVQIAGAGSYGGSSSRGSGGGGGRQDDSVRQERIEGQSALRTAAILVAARAISGEKVSWDDYLKLTDSVRREIGRGQTTPSTVPPATQPMPEQRRDIERTGVSDIPTTVGQFNPPSNPSDDDVPF